MGKQGSSFLGANGTGRSSGEMGGADWEEDLRKQQAIRRRTNAADDDETDAELLQMQVLCYENCCILILYVHSLFMCHL